MDGIVEIQLRRLRALLADRQIALDIDAAGTAWLADRGFDPAYGARPLKRVIQNHLQNPLAGKILEGAVKEGDTVRVTAEDGNLRILPGRAS